MMTCVNANLTSKLSGLIRVSIAALGLALFAPSALAQESDILPPTPAELATYADLVDMAERSDLVIRAEIRRQIVVEPDRAPGLAPGFARLYIEARTQALISGNTTLGESLAYLVDVPLNERGKPDKLKDKVMLLFANPVPGGNN